MQVLLIVFFGAMEFGQFLYIRHAFQAAARDAARAASLPSATNATVLAAATGTLAQASVQLNAAWYTVSDVSSDVTSVPSGDRVQVTIATTYDQVPNACRPLVQVFGKGIGTGKVMAGTCTMVKE